MGYVSSQSLLFHCFLNCYCRAVNLLETYGVIPQDIFPESFHSSLTGPLNSLLKTKLREHAIILRNLHSTLRAQSTLSAAAITATLRSKKEELMKEIYTIMSATLGAPPSPDSVFTWDYYDEHRKPGSWTGTALEFYKTFGGKHSVGAYQSVEDRGLTVF